MWDSFTLACAIPYETSYEALRQKGQVTGARPQRRASDLRHVYTSNFSPLREKPNESQSTPSFGGGASGMISSCACFEAPPAIAVTDVRCGEGLGKE